MYLELEYSGFIPDSYIAEPMAKMEMYKKIASIASDAELEAVERELEDRFGPPPEEVRSLFGIAEIRVLCRRLYVSSLKESKESARVEFLRVAQVSVDRVLRLIAESGGSVALDPKAPHCLLDPHRQHRPEGEVGVHQRAAVAPAVDPYGRSASGR